MQIEFIPQPHYQTTAWSGGQTTQICIYPPTGDYAKRDFLYRVSSATVELEISEFTSLPGVDRFLTTLDAPLKLTHKGIRELTLHPFEVEHFLGEWETVSEGRVQDFNLMLKGGAKGEMSCSRIQPGERLTITSGENSEHHLFYVAQGTADVCGHALSKGETLRILTDASEEMIVENIGMGSVQMICLCVRC